MPTMAAFRSHCEHDHYQATLWKAAGMQSPSSLYPLKNGWEKKSSTLQLVYLIEGQSVAPDEVPNLTSCGSKMDCKSALCCCTKFTKFSPAYTEVCKSMSSDVGCGNSMKAMLQGESDDSKW